MIVRLLSGSNALKDACHSVVVSNRAARDAARNDYLALLNLVD